jgi:hypothetical protein
MPCVIVERMRETRRRQRRAEKEKAISAIARVGG